MQHEKRDRSITSGDSTTTTMIPKSYLHPTLLIESLQENIPAGQTEIPVDDLRRWIRMFEQSTLKMQEEIIQPQFSNGTTSEDIQKLKFLTERYEEFIATNNHHTSKTTTTTTANNNNFSVPATTTDVWPNNDDNEDMVDAVIVPNDVRPFKDDNCMNHPMMSTNIDDDHGTIVTTSTMPIEILEPHKIDTSTTFVPTGEVQDSAAAVTTISAIDDHHLQQ